MKRISLALVATAVLISACGTRPDETSDCGAAIYDSSGLVVSGCDSPATGAALPVVLNVRAITNANDIKTGGTEAATITALITDDSNRAVPGSAVLFSANGGVLQNMSTETDENGTATAELTLAGDFRNQNIVVDVVSGGATDQVLIAASGTEIDISGPTALVLGDTAELTVTLSAGNGEPIANEELMFSSSANNTITPATATTDSDGRAIITVNSDNGDDVISVTALDGTAIGSHDLNVAEDLLSFVSPADGAELAVGGSHTIQVRWISDGQPIIGQQLRFGITAGQIVTSNLVTTDGSGNASIQVSSSSAGPGTITVAAADDGDPATQHDIEFVATTPATLALSSSSSRVATTDSSTITALVTDVNGNPVKNQEVVFYSADLKGGQLNPASGTTNSEGEATSTFTAGNLATEFNDVTISADVGGMAISGSTQLTVVERVLNVTLGTSGLLEFIAGETQYGLPFAVQVADGGGAPLENATVEVSITPLTYRKGELVIKEDADGNTAWDYSDDSIGCLSEDLNGNRLLDVGEDVNGNGVLDPQDPALIAAHSSETPTVSGGSITTDANGSGYFSLVYPASSAWWSNVRITARAKALGVEAEESFTTELLVNEDRVDDGDDYPPNIVSPYGTANVCSDPN
ncbi:MAG: Ig-like domain-containing protein [Gammaproteobacteria bacterium]|nr:Ig-like domain-containing protein [Gammaproteobacteria bacterium]